MANMRYARLGHYKIHAYVCGAGCLKLPDVDGVVNFETVYTKRPDGCRYVVVGQWSVAKHGEIYEVVDLYAVSFKGLTKRIVMPSALLICEDLDAAIMAAMMLYEGEA